MSKVTVKGGGGGGGGGVLANFGNSDFSKHFSIQIALSQKQQVGRG